MTSFKSAGEAGHTATASPLCFRLNPKAPHTQNAPCVCVFQDGDDKFVHVASGWRMIFKPLRCCWLSEKSHRRVRGLLTNPQGGFKSVFVSAAHGCVELKLASLLDGCSSALLLSCK